MEHQSELKNTLSWHSPDGTFEVILINGQITKLEFCEIGKCEDGCLKSTDYKFLMQVFECLGDLKKFIADQDKERGHTFAGDAVGKVGAFRVDEKEERV